MSTGKALLHFEDVCLAYGRRVVLDHLTFDIEEGEFLGIVGPNGSGKTTLLRAILNTLRPRRGRITRGGLESSTLRTLEKSQAAKPPNACHLTPATRAISCLLSCVSMPRTLGDDGLRFGYVPQREFVNEMFPLTVHDIVMMGRFPLVGLLRPMGRRDRQVAMDCLEAVGISHLGNAQYRNLSGGQKQRVLIARALATEPHILVLDEPTNGMDLTSEHAIMELVRSLHAAGGRTILMVTHILNLVANYVQRIALLSDDRLVIGPTAEVLSETNLRNLYGVGVCVREVEGRLVLVSVPGEANANGPLSAAGGTRGGPAGVKQPNASSGENGRRE